MNAAPRDIEHVPRVHRVVRVRDGRSISGLRLLEPERHFSIGFEMRRHRGRCSRLVSGIGRGRDAHDFHKSGMPVERVGGEYLDTAQRIVERSWQWERAVQRGAQRGSLGA